MNIVKKNIVLLTLMAAGLSVSAQAENQPSYIPQGYVVETITLPDTDRFEVAGIDINAQGDLAVSTRDGEVWILKAKFAMSKTIESSQWSKFAEGLGEATGIHWKSDGSLVVAQKPELTQLIDTNDDGKADRQINLANQWAWDQNYHEFHFGGVEDSKGNVYGTLNLASGIKGYKWRGKSASMTSRGGYRGWAYKLTPAGDFIPFAAGFRSPAGVGLSPNDELFVTDNQGDWIPTSNLHHVEQGDFHGHPVSLIDKEGFTPEKIDKMSTDELWKMMKKPAVWIPHDEVSRSPGNPVWDTTAGKFGPFTEQIFIPEYTNSSLFRVMLEKVGGAYQGAAINFIDGFQSGNIRADFDPEGRLWIGQTARGWPTTGTEPYGIQRVSYQGKTAPFELLNISLTKTGFDLTFTQPLDKASLSIDTINASQWHYNYWNTYGSPKVDEKALKISAVKLTNNGKTLSLTLPLTAEKVVGLDFSQLKNANGKKTSTGQVYYTLNRLQE